MRYKKSFGEKVVTAIIYGIICILTLAFLYPVIYCLSLSLSDAATLGGQPIGLLPKGFSLDAYVYLLSSNKLLQYYGNTILYAGLGTLITLLVTSMIAYALSDQYFSGKKVITVFLVVTMFFAGGLVPTYLNIKRLGLIDTVWVMVLPGSVSAYNVMVYKTFFKQLPSSIKRIGKSGWCRTFSDSVYHGAASFQTSSGYHGVVFHCNPLEWLHECGTLP